MGKVRSPQANGPAANEPAPDEPAVEGRLRLHCIGLLQGVGFRPFVYRLASEARLQGTVANVAGAVLVDLQGPLSALEDLLRRLSEELPPGARLEVIRSHWLPPRRPAPRGLRLEAAPPTPLGAGLVAPALAADRAPCSSCLAELHDPANRRFGYPFISCASCGPRYSIATAEPFARAHTTLVGFPLCASCQREFEDPGDRRFHAETIGCPVCGPRLQLLGLDPDRSPPPEVQPESAEPLAAAAALLRQGAIVALQGVGGFQLLVDATDAAAVARLRRRKGRPGKPFALLVGDPALLAGLVELSGEEERQLRSPAAPIVLLRRRSAAGEALPGVAPGSAALGVMLPASALHQLLVEAVNRPLVATSGNRSGELLCIDPLEASRRLAGIADAFLVHNRPIARPLDDSLLQVVEGRVSLLRRARGYAPEPLELPASASLPAARTPVLALGGDLKSAPALLQDGRIWSAPHLGDLGGERQQQWLEQGLAELIQRCGAASPALVCDLHPGYLSHGLARRLAAGLSGSSPWVGPLDVQHHHAHGLAVAAEHGLDLPLLAWTCDGLGLAPEGSSHQLWGCELLWITPAGSERLAGLRPFPLPGGEAAMRQGARVALGLLLAAGREALDHPGALPLREAFAEDHWDLLCQAVGAGLQAPLSSSLGRLFDASAALLDVCLEQSYEGEAGLRLEGLALQGLGLPATPDWFTSPPPPLPCLPAAGLELGWLDWGPLLEGLLLRRQDLRPLSDAAAWLHATLAEALAALAAKAAARRGTRLVALAGGCFQNRLLLESTAAALRRRGLVPWWSQQLPCNDGGLALGQIWAALLKGAAEPIDQQIDL